MEFSDSATTSRRSFLKTLGFVSIGFPMLGGRLFEENLPDQSLPYSLRDYPKINSWIHVLENGQVRVLTGKIELGQGLQTAIMQVAAEELDMDMKLVEIVMADTELTPDEGYTVGSRSMETSALAVRYAAAAAREKILELAATKYQTKQDGLSFKDGIIYSHGRKKGSLQELLAGKQIEDIVRSPVKLKDKKDYRFVGKAMPRRDIEKIIRGQAVFVQDLRFPGMVHARVVRPRGYDAKLLTYDKEKAIAIPGVLKIIEDGSFLAVVAEDEFSAIKAQKYLKSLSKWSDPEKLPDGKPLKEHIKGLPADSSNDVNKGAFASTDTSIKASYFKPYIMHGANGPSCAVARFHEGKLTISSHSQGIFSLREAISKMLDLDESNIHIVGVAGAGCYGHNGADDVAAEAALLAMSYPDRHIRLQWMRDEEHGWEPYGSAMIMEFDASLDKDGKISHWKYDLWSDSHSTRPGGNPGNLLPARYIEKSSTAPGGGFRGGALRNAEPYYQIPNLTINSHIFEGPLRISALRGLGAYANVFAIESFMDELAEKAGEDVFKFRLGHLKDLRAIDCIKRLQEMTQQVRTNDYEGFGIAFSRYKNSAAYCAVATLVGFDRNSKKTVIKKMWAVADAGEAINLDGIKNQIEGGMIQSASWTLMEEVVFDHEHVTGLNWATYPMLRYDNAPETEVEVINRPYEEPLGAGEAAQGPAAAALANAVYKATGQRVRDLPINKHLS